MCRHHHVLLLLYRNLQPFSSVSPHQRQQTLKTPQNFTQKSKFLPQKFKYTTPTAKNRHLQLRSPRTIKMCHRIRGFPLFLSPLTSIYLIFNAPCTNHHTFRSNYNHKSILFTRSVSINRPSTSKTAAPQSSPITKTFFYTT